MKFENNLQTDIYCPECSPLIKLMVKTNRTTEHQFLGCPNWPECNYTRPIPEAWKMRAMGQAGLFDGIEQPNPASTQTALSPEGKQGELFK